MLDHVTIRVSDRDASRRFYSLALGEPTYEGAQFLEWDSFSIAVGEPTRNLHLGFEAASSAAVEAWWSRLIAAGYRDAGHAAPRPEYGGHYYGGFVLDPDGNSIEAVCNPPLRGAQIDHLWLRTENLAASRAFWQAVAPHVGIWRTHDSTERIQYVGERGTFSVVLGDASTNVHLAFPVGDNAAVEAFHRASLAAGHRDNGAPGERPEYHPGYCGAFVLDPDGNNIEAVCHNR